MTNIAVDENTNSRGIINFTLPADVCLMTNITVADNTNMGGITKITHY